MDDLPVIKPSQKLARFQKKVRIMRPSESGLLDSVGLIKDIPSFPDGSLDVRYQRPVKIPEGEHCSVIGIWQGIDSIDFQINMPDFYPQSLFGRLEGDLIQAF